MKLRVYKKIFNNYFSQELQNKVDIAGYLVVMFIYLLSALLFWNAIYNDNSMIAGYGREDMVLYYTLVGMVAYSMSMSTTDEISKKIKYGKLSQELIKPYEIINVEFLRVLANRLYNVSVFFIVFVAVLVVMVFRGWISINLAGLIKAIPILLLGFLIKYYIMYFIGLFAFWLNEVWFLNHIRRIVINFFSGIFFPIVLFPFWLQYGLQFLPFRYLFPLPMQYINSEITNQQLPLDIFIGIAWCIILGGLCQFTYKLGIKKYEAFGN